MRLGLCNFKNNRNFSKKCFRMLRSVIGRNVEYQAIYPGDNLSVFGHKRCASTRCIGEAISKQLPLISRENFQGNFDADGGAAA